VLRWPGLFQLGSERSAANERVVNEEVQVDSFIIPLLPSSNWIYAPMTNGHAFEIVGGLSFF